MNERCLLIVEDDVLIRHPLAEYLRQCGYLVLEAGSHEEARLLLRDPSHDVDIVLADANPKGGSGFVLASWIRVNCPGVEVVLAGTVAASVSAAGDLCEDGPAVTKPYDHQLVLRHIRRLQAARRRGL